jgi:hypothetical protein
VKAKTVDRDLINAIREESERTKDDPYPEGATYTRPNRERSRVYSIRLSDAAMTFVPTSRYRLVDDEPGNLDTACCGGVEQVNGEAAVAGRAGDRGDHARYGVAERTLDGCHHD